MKSPKVSVIIPNFNHDRYLAQRIDSVLNQTFGDLEIIILDDASTDSSHAVLARYYTKPRVHIAVNTRNSGSAFPQWNRGIEMARGEYVWIAESDDSSQPRFLETLISILDENPQLGLAYCRSKLIDTNGAELGDSLAWTADLHPQRWTANFCNCGRDELRNFLTCKNTIPNASAVLSRRSVWQQVAPVDASFKLCGDWLHWGKMLLVSDLAYVSQPLNLWRTGSSNSRSALPGAQEWEEGKRVLTCFTQALNLNSTETLSVFVSYADRCLKWASDRADSTSSPKIPQPRTTSALHCI
jgi:glycosyltransferase involved in cell wall biosynthesis